MQTNTQSKNVKPQVKYLNALHHILRLFMSKILNYNYFSLLDHSAKFGIII